MTTNTATSPAIFAPRAASGQVSDPVRARMIVPQQLTNDQVLQADTAHYADEVAPRRLHLVPDTRGGGPNGNFPDNKINSSDDLFKFNQMLTVSLGFSFPFTPTLSD